MNSVKFKLIWACFLLMAEAGGWSQADDTTPYNIPPYASPLAQPLPSSVTPSFRRPIDPDRQISIDLENTFIIRKYRADSIKTAILKQDWAMALYNYREIFHAWPESRFRNIVPEYSEIFEKEGDELITYWNDPRSAEKYYLTGYALALYFWPEDISGKEELIIRLKQKILSKSTFQTLSNDAFSQKIRQDRRDSDFLALGEIAIFQEFHPNHVDLNQQSADILSNVMADRLPDRAHEKLSTNEKDIALWIAKKENIFGKAFKDQNGTHALIRCQVSRNGKEVKYKIRRFSGNDVVRQRITDFVTDKRFSGDFPGFLNESFPKEGFIYFDLSSRPSNTSEKQFKELSSSIKRNWRYPKTLLPGHKFRAQFAFIISNKDGTLLDYEMMKSSGNRSVDHSLLSVLEQFKNTSQPPPPTSDNCFLAAFRFDLTYYK